MVVSRAFHPQVKFLRVFQAKNLYYHVSRPIQPSSSLVYGVKPFTHPVVTQTSLYYLWKSVVTLQGAVYALHVQDPSQGDE